MRQIAKNVLDAAVAQGALRRMRPIRQGVSRGWRAHMIKPTKPKTDLDGPSDNLVAAAGTFSQLTNTAFRMFARAAVRTFNEAFVAGLVELRTKSTWGQPAKVATVRVAMKDGNRTL